MCPTLLKKYSMCFSQRSTTTEKMQMRRPASKTSLNYRLKLLLVIRQLFLQQ